MADKFQEESRLLRGKREVVAGTAEVLANTDGDVRGRELDLSSLDIDFDNESSKFASGDHTHDNAISGSARGSISFGVRACVGYAIHEDTVFTEAHLEYAKYMQGAGLVEVFTEPTDSVTNDGTWVYSPSIDADENTVTIELVDKQSTTYAIGYEFAGAMSTLVIGAESTGAPITAQFDFGGKVSQINEYDGAGNVPIFWDNDTSVDAEKKMSTTFLSTDVIFTELGEAGAEGDSIEFCLDSFSLDTGSGIAEHTCQSDDFGILNNVITTREPMLTIDPLLQSLQEFDFWSAISTEQEYKIEIVRRVDTGESFRIDIPRAQIMSPDISASDGFIRNTLTVRPLRPFPNGQSSREADYTITIGCYSYDRVTPLV